MSIDPPAGGAPLSLPAPSATFVPDIASPGVSGMPGGSAASHPAAEPPTSVPPLVRPLVPGVPLPPAVLPDVDDNDEEVA